MLVDTLKHLKVTFAQEWKLYILSMRFFIVFRGNDVLTQYVQEKAGTRSTLIFMHCNSDQY